MRWSVVVACLLAFVAPLLSGCTEGGSGCGNSPDGQTCTGPGTVVYNGASDGTQTSKPLECPGSGHISWTSNIGSGSVTITVSDDLGAVKFTKKLTGPGQSADEQAVSGASGEWTVRAVRSGGTFGTPFSGQYMANLHC